MQRNFVFGRIFPYGSVFFCWSRCFSYRLTVILPLLSKIQCLNFLEFLNPWGKVSERSGLIFENFAHKGSKIVTAIFFLWIVFFICSVRVNAFLPLFPEVQCPNFLNFRNPLGKVMKRFCLRFENFCF